MLKQKAFYTKNLKAQYEKVEFGRFINHLCFCNFEFSRKMAKRILIGINKANSDEIGGYLCALVPYLAMTD